MSGLVLAQSIATAAYIVAALLFILALAGLSRHETARAGNVFGITGMAIALVATAATALGGAKVIFPGGDGGLDREQAMIRRAATSSVRWNLMVRRM